MGSFPPSPRVSPGLGEGVGKVSSHHQGCGRLEGAASSSEQLAVFLGEAVGAKTSCAPTPTDQSRSWVGKHGKCPGPAPST